MSTSSQKDNSSEKYTFIQFIQSLKLRRKICALILLVALILSCEWGYELLTRSQPLLEKIHQYTELNDKVIFAVNQGYALDQPTALLSPDSEFTVSDSVINLDVIIPLGETIFGETIELDDLSLYTNNIKIVDQNQISKRPLYYNLIKSINYSNDKLRRGINIIRASRIKTDTNEENTLGSVRVNYIPEKPIQPVLLGWIKEPNSRKSIIQGIAEPLSNISIDTGSEINTTLKTDAAGFFKLPLPEEIDDSLEQPFKIKFSPLSETYRNDRSSVLNITPTTDKTINSYNSKGQINVSIPNDLKTISIDFEVQLPDKSVIYEWVREGKVTSQELAAWIFGFGAWNTNRPSFYSSFSPEMEAESLILSLSESQGEQDQKDVPELNDRVLRFSTSVAIPPEESISLGFFRVPAVLPETLRIEAPKNSSVQIEEQNNKTTSIKPNNRVAYFWKQPFSGQQGSINSESTIFVNIASSSNSGASTLREQTTPINSSNRTSSSEQKSVTFVRFLLDLPNKVPGFIIDVLQILFYATPFFWLLFILNKPEQQEIEEQKLMVVATTVTFLTLYLIRLVNIINLPYVIELPFLFYKFQEGFKVVLIVGITFLMLPIFEAHQCNHYTQPSIFKVVRDFALVSVAYIGAFIGLAFILVGFIDNSSAPIPEILLPWSELISDISPHLIIPILSSLTIIVGSTLLLILLTWCLVSTLVGRRLALGSVIKTTLVIITINLFSTLLTILTQFIFYFSTNPEPHVVNLNFNPVATILLLLSFKNVFWLGVAISIGTICLYNIKYIISQLVELPNYLGLDPNLNRIVLVGIFIITSIPFGTQSQFREDYFLLSSVIFSISSLLRYALLIGLLTVLKLLSKQYQFNIGWHIQEVGALLFAFYLAASTANIIFFLPLLVISRYIFLKWVLSVPSSEPIIIGEEPKRLLLDGLLRYKEANQVYSERHRGLIKQVLLEKLELNDWVGKIDEFKAYRDERKKSLLNLLKRFQKSSSNLSQTEQIIFGMGSEVSPWANAMVMVYYGSILSFPFILQPLIQIFRSEQNLATYPILSAMHKLLFVASSWLLIAFIFGYFFHHIRGKNGLLKGLVYTAALIGPSIILRFLSDEPFLDQSHLGQVSQVIIYVLLLGLLFDWRTLQKLNYGWRDQFSVYGLVTISLTLAPSVLIPIISSIFFKGKEPIELFQEFIKLLFGLGK